MSKTTYDKPCIEKFSRKDFGLWKVGNCYILQQFSYSAMLANVVTVIFKADYLCRETPSLHTGARDMLIGLV